VSHLWSRGVDVVQGSLPTADLERCSGVGPALQPDEPAPHGWPQHSYLELGALPAAVARARLHVRNLLWEWGLDWLAADTELLVSELVTSAVKAAVARDQAAVRLRLSGDSTRVLIEVWDANRLLPSTRYPAADGASGRQPDGGRGLRLVAALSARWNWYLTEEPAGKVVWCEVRALSRELAPRFVRDKEAAEVGAGGERGRGTVPSSGRVKRAWDGGRSAYCAGLSARP
jgi:anti-sigma regulatory factor (Ser/Thr protein kinase)